MLISDEQEEFIRKQYNKCLDGEFRISQLNEKLQKRLKVTFDLKPIIIECIANDKAPSHISRFLRESC